MPGGEGMRSAPGVEVEGVVVVYVRVVFVAELASLPPLAMAPKIFTSCLCGGVAPSTAETIQPARSADLAPLGLNAVLVPVV